jgi:hypothetical protein
VASGIIFREKLSIQTVFQPLWHRAVWQKPIKSFIDKTRLSIDQNTPIELVSKQPTSTMRNDQALLLQLTGTCRHRNNTGFA